jgi:hypothetical protein
MYWIKLLRIWLNVGLLSTGLCIFGLKKKGMSYFNYVVIIRWSKMTLKKGAQCL